jgi:O-antigen/teichoic acid export membrane protein
VNTGFVRALRIVSTIVLARLLTASDFGLYAMAIVVVNFMQEFAVSGLSNVVIREGYADRRLPGTLLTLNLMLGAGLGLLSLGAAPLVARAYGEPRLTAILAGLSLLFATDPLGNFASWLLRRELRFRPIALVEIGAAALSFAVILGLAAAGRGVMALVWGSVAGSCARSAAYAATALRLRLLPRPEWRWRALRAEREMLRYAGLQVCERLTYFLGNNLDFVVVGAVLGAAQLGVYSLAYNLVISLVRTIAAPFAGVAFPLFSRLAGRREALHEAFFGQLGAFALALLPTLALAGIAAGEVIVRVYGARWAPSVPVFRGLLVFGAVYGLRSLTTTALQAQGRAGVSLGLALAMLPVTASAEYLGARIHGTPGVAVALSLTALVVLAPLDLAVRLRVLAMRVRSTARALGLPLLAAAGLLAVSLAADRQLAGAASLQRVAVAAAAYALGLLAVLGRGRFRAAAVPAQGG